MEDLKFKEALELIVETNLEREEYKRLEFLNVVTKNPDIDSDCNLYEIIVNQRMMYDKQYRLLLDFQKYLSNVDILNESNFNELMRYILLLEDNANLEAFNLFSIDLLAVLMRSTDIQFFMVKDLLSNIISKDENFENKDEICSKLVKDIKMNFEDYNDNYEKIKKKERSLKK